MLYSDSLLTGKRRSRVQLRPRNPKVKGKNRSKVANQKRNHNLRQYVSFEVVLPALNSRLEIRGEEHYADILGFPCYLGNSEHANVVYRGDDFDAASNIDGLHHTSCGDWQALVIAAKLSCRAQWAACVIVDTIWASAVAFFPR